MNLNFEWDEEKAESNMIKHGISFETAAKVFLEKTVSKFMMQCTVT